MRRVPCAGDLGSMGVMIRWLPSQPLLNATWGEAGFQKEGEGINSATTWPWFCRKIMLCRLEFREGLWETNHSASPDF